MDDESHDRPADREPSQAEDAALLAELDRGWEQLEQGNLEAAATAAAAALALEPESPEGSTLLGAIAAARGEVQAAVGHYERAMKLDPDYLEPHLLAAELHIHPLGQLEEAIELCDAALEIAEEEEEFLDALLLKAEAQLELGDEDGARTTLDELPPVRLPEARLAVRAGRALLDLGELPAAEKQLRDALALEPGMSDALHGLALVHEQRGELSQMVELFLQVREADLAEPPPPWAVPRERFEELAQQALEELPEVLRSRLANVPILAADYPSVEVVAEGNDPRMMGFFSGVPYPEKSSLGAVPQLDCVFLYQRNIEQACGSAPEVEEEIRRTLIHETGHFFGLSEEELEEMGLG
jgi:predicted Zn-dependent protease with MMP-like domain/Flp pilus assembly protein TadD